LISGPSIKNQSHWYYQRGILPLPAWQGLELNTKAILISISREEEFGVFLELDNSELGEFLKLDSNSINTF
jgi:hypothetical protein